MIIFGVDPGTATTGYGVIRATRRQGLRPRFRCLAYGVIQTPKEKSAQERLLMLEKQLTKLLRSHRPSLVVVESLYAFRNLKSVMTVAQAKGVVLLAVAKQGLPLREVFPLQMKKVVTGYGRADKKQLQQKVQKMLKLPSVLKSDDAADALGLAIASFLLRA